MSAAMGIAAVAQRYARALFELAREQEALKEVEQDMRALLAALDESPELARFVKSPLLSPEQQQAAMAAVLEKMGAHELTRRALAVLIANRRLAMLAQVAQAFLALLAEQRGEITVRAITAAPLTRPQAEKLKKALKAALGREADIENDVDPQLLGGLVLHVGSRMIDASVKRRLTALQGLLKGV